MDPDRRADPRPLFLGLPAAGLHFDVVRGQAEIPRLLETFPADKILSLGIVDGRNIWKNDFESSLAILTLGRFDNQRVADILIQMVR